MEIILLIIAGVVLYFLYNGFQDYMKNPYKRDEENAYKAEYNPSDNPYIETSPEDKLKKREYGVLAGILHEIAASDGEICPLERELVCDMLDDMAKEIDDLAQPREILQNIFDNNKENLDDLARLFVDLTHGEYKKRLKVVEFLFALAYADGILSEIEREKIIDVAAIFELNNDDFNKIYDDFEEIYSKNVEMTKARALEIFSLNEDYKKDDLEAKYKELIKQNKQNVLASKNLNKNFRDSSLNILRDIDEAYNLLKAESMESAKSMESAESIAESSAESIK